MSTLASKKGKNIKLYFYTALVGGRGLCIWVAWCVIFEHFGWVFTRKKIGAPTKHNPQPDSYQAQ